MRQGLKPSVLSGSQDQDPFLSSFAGIVTSFSRLSFRLSTSMGRTAIATRHQGHEQTIEGMLFVPIYPCSRGAA